ITLNAGGSYITLDANAIETATAGDVRIKAPHLEYFPGKVSQAARLGALPVPIDPPLAFNQQFRIFADDAEQALANMPYTITAAGGKVWKGSTDSQGFTQRVFTANPEELSLSYGLEEEEEEEELDGITLRLGLFFDGTGNNQANAAATEQCRREDLQLFDRDELASIVQQCEQYGFDGFDGDGFDRGPDDSFGNAPSNVAHLYDLYPDHSTEELPPGAGIGYVPVYLEGIGTRSGGNDSLFGQGTGRGGTGVVARVEQAPEVMEKQLDRFLQANPYTPIRRIEFDIFGFSRGAAAARHCANELLKPGRGLFSELLQAGRFGLQASFDPAVDVSLNLIGLFDTVAAIVGLDLSPANDHNPGVNLYLPPGCARQVIQLQARDECRHNFALNSVLHGHQQISLPGVHSDIGGGYLPRGRERLWLTQPRRISLPAHRPITSHPLWAQAHAQVQALRASGLAGEGQLTIKSWPISRAPSGKLEPDELEHLLTIELERPVRGELALIALRVMRELGVRHGAPFDVIDDQDHRFRLPEELQSIAAHILDQALGGTVVSLDPAQERLLRGRYIHQSAHWIPKRGMLINKPAADNTRNIYSNQPQKGYPQ
ncbi:DUF2235 domain-containing protein, partial [Pseudomonas sp. BC115LW]|uniref:DUF2235 domain-containing protein n=1 Tax=Pseudomonas sp. BC115LW TaxID=2683267 RepID=UPI001413076D